MTTAAPDHTAEYTRADNAIRLLTFRLDALRGIVADLNTIDVTPGEDERTAQTGFVNAAGAPECVEILIRRETARRDAAELAQRAAAPASLFPSPERLAWERNR